MSDENPELPGADVERRACRSLETLDGRIRNEYDFISSRTGWLLASHAFLFTGLAVLLNQPVSTVPRVRILRTVMQLALPLIGIMSSYLIWSAIRGAYNVLRLNLELTAELQELLASKFLYRFVTPPRHHLRAGARPPLWLPLILGTVWLILLSLIVADVAETLIYSGVFAISRDV
jgi:hypothetical protein